MLCTGAGGAAAAEPTLGAIVDGAVQSTGRAVAEVTPAQPAAAQTATAATTEPAAAAQPAVQPAAPAAEAVRSTAEPVAQVVRRTSEPVAQVVRRASVPVDRAAAPLEEAARRTAGPVAGAGEPAVHTPDLPVASIGRHPKLRTQQPSTPGSAGGTPADPPAAPSAGPATAAQPVTEVAPPVAPQTGRDAALWRPPTGLLPAVPASQTHAATLTTSAPSARDRSAPPGAAAAVDPPDDGPRAAVGPESGVIGSAAGAAFVALLLGALLFHAPTLARQLVIGGAPERAAPVLSPLERPG
jgi:hypothetical protein